MITFSSPLRKAGKWIIIQLPEKASLALPSRGQVSVTGTINGRDFKQVLEPDGRWGHWFKISKQLQDSLGITVGDTVTFDIEPSKIWPEPVVPKDFMKALDDAPVKIQDLWKHITPMARWEWIRWVNATSVDETRARRVEVSISKMQSGKRRPCCFNLAACTDPDLSKNGRLIETTN